MLKSNCLLKPINYIYGTIACFLCANVLLRFHAVYNYNVAATTVIALSAACCGFIVIFPKYLKKFLSFLGASFILFGFHPYSIYNQTLELILTMFSLTLLVLSIRFGNFTKINRQLPCLLILYISLSLFSVLLMPVGNISKTLSLWGVFEFADTVVFATPDSYFYPISAVNRLVLFFLFALLMATIDNAKDIFKTFFIGILIGAILSVILGLFDYYSIISLEWYRVLDPIENPQGIQARLQSTFGHPGWFAEFVTVTIPFILMGLLKPDRNRFRIILIFSILVLVEVALILVRARSGWICYPLTLVFCWIFVHLFRQDEKVTRWNIDTKGIVKVFISLPVTAIVSIIVIIAFLGPLNVSVQKILKNESKKQNLAESHVVRKRLEMEHENLKKRVAKQASFKHRITGLFRTSERTWIWGQGINIGQESPLFGMGYESFAWHQGILEQRKMADSYLRQKWSPEQILLADTPHSLYVQLFVSGGIVGLIFWTVILVYVAVVLVHDIADRKNYFGICVILALIAFHIYGIFQSMQYIPVIWLLIFLYFGYAMTVRETILTLRQRAYWSIYIVLGFMIVITGIFVYFHNHGSNQLTRKFSKLNGGTTLYAKDQDRDNYIGFYHSERWPGNRLDWRWSGRGAIMRLKKSGVIALTIVCDHPDVEKHPVFLTIFKGSSVLDRILFTQKGAINKQYYIPKSSNKTRELRFKISRTWNPKKLGFSGDSRNLGLAVSGPQFLGKMPDEGIGFYQWETWKGAPIKEWSKGIAQNFRWIGMRATLPLTQKLRNGINLFLKCSHPDIQANTVKLNLFKDNKSIKQIKFTDNSWKKVTLNASDVNDGRFLTFQPNRVWNPRLAGASDDFRDLGVAVAYLPLN